MLYFANRYIAPVNIVNVLQSVSYNHMQTFRWFARFEVFFLSKGDSPPVGSDAHDMMNFFDPEIGGLLSWIYSTHRYINCHCDWYVWRWRIWSFILSSGAGRIRWGLLYSASAQRSHSLPAVLCIRVYAVYGFTKPVLIVLFSVFFVRKISHPSESYHFNFTSFKRSAYQWMHT